jgi:hypothetical protein
MDKKKRLIIFCGAMIFALVFWRLGVFLKSGDVGSLREISGLNVHHYTYGAIMIFVACLVFIFYRVEKYSLFLAGFGFGSFFDGLASRLITQSIRSLEITRYDSCFGLSVFLFFVLVLFCIDFYLFSKRYKN